MSGVGDAAVTGAGDAPYTLVYDGECAVCIRSVNALRNRDRDGRFEMVAYQSEGVMARFPAISRREFTESVQLIGPGGERWAGAGAVEKVLDLVPGTRVLSRLFRIPLVRPIARWAYHLFARNRGRFGCGDHCPIV